MQEGIQKPVYSDMINALVLSAPGRVQEVSATVSLSSCVQATRNHS
jgi:hypothetical protein